MFMNVFNGWLRLETPLDANRLFIVVPNRIAGSLIEVKCDESPEQSAVGTLVELNDISYPVLGRLVMNENVCLFDGSHFTLEKEDGSVEKLFLYPDENNQSLSLFRETDRESILVSDMHPWCGSLYPWMRKYSRLFTGMVVKFNTHLLRIQNIIEINTPMICGTFLECHVLYEGKPVEARTTYIPAAWAIYTGLFVNGPEYTAMVGTKALKYHEEVYDLCRAESLKYGTSIEQVDWEDSNFEE